MTLEPWWKNCPEWLDAELAAFDKAGIRYRRDEASFASGVARFHLEVDLPGETVQLVVTYPDLYPYFRFEVQAPALVLHHHQNPYQKNLCLLGRRTEYWHTSDTAASVIQEKLAQVLRTGRSENRDSVVGVEQAQAEPLSDYYPYPPSMIIVQSGWSIGNDHQIGRFVLGTAGPQGLPPTSFVRGAILELQTDGQRPLWQADTSLRRAYPGRPLCGRWVRVKKPICTPNEVEFLRQLFEQNPSARNAPTNKVDGGWLQLWGVLFPEEVGHREVGEGWVFVCRFDEKIDRLMKKVESVQKLGTIRR